MPPVVAGLGVVATAVSGAFVAAGTATAAAFGAGAVGAGLFTTAFQQVALGLGMTALGQALAPKQGGLGSGQRPAGVRLTPDVGETGPMSFIMGRAATAGELVFHGSYKDPDSKTPNKTYVQVFELSDVPLTKLRRYWINGEWAELEPHDFDGRGQPVKGYRLKNDKLWVKFYDGTQTVADPHLVAKFPPPYAQPWTADMIGRGIAYIVVTSDFAPEIHAQRPTCLVEVDGIALYDPRKDSSLGGSGPQRRALPATWRFSDNPKVLEYNTLLGIRDPVSGKHLWGGQGIRQQDLPAGEWFAAMNECDARGFTAGIEVRVNEEPATVCEEFNRACQGRTVEVAGVWHTRAGPPGLPVYFFTDADVVVTAPDSFTPFPQLSESFNGARAQHPDPALGWRMRDAPALDRPDYLLADKGRVNVAALQYRAVFNRRQVQKLKLAALKDSRRWRKHALVLPPDARALTPIDTIAWTSERNGYSSKAFEMPMLEDLENGCCALGLREWDPADYDYDEVDIPGDDGYTVRPPRVPVQSDFAVAASTVRDANGVDRAPAIDLLWSRTHRNVDAVRYRIRLAATHAHLPVAGQASVPEASETASAFMRINGETARLNAQPVTYSVFTDIDEGKLTISEGIKNLTGYEVQAIFSPVTGRTWSEWMPVTTLDVRLTELDFADEVRQVIHDARDRAQEAAADVLAMQAQLNAIAALVDGLSEETLDRADAILAALAGLDVDAITALTGLAVAGLRKGDFAADPTFRDWSGTNLVQWTGVGVSTFGTKVTGGTPPPTYGTALRLTVPAGAGVASVTASSAVAGQLPGADLKAEYLVLSALLRVFSGSLAGGRLRVEWRATGTSVWTHGHAFGVLNSPGRMVEDYGLEVDALRFQSRETVWRRPVASADGVRLVMIAKEATPTLAVDLRLDYLGLTRATEAEVAGYNAFGLASTAITDLRTEIIGPSGALASAVASIEAEFGPAVAMVTGGSFALATDVLAMAGEINQIAVSFGDPNMVRNPQFVDGARAAGIAPAFWDAWPAGMSVEAINPASASANRRVAPTPFFAVVAGDGLQWSATAFDDIPVRPGEKLKPAIAVAVAGSGATSTLVTRIEYRADPAAAALSPVHVSTMTVTNASSGWVRPDWPALTVPSGAAFARLVVRRQAGAVGETLFTQVETRKGDPIAQADITTLQSVKVDAAGAVAAFKTEIGAEFGSYGAFVTQTQAAIATSDLAASTYTIRATAGAGSAGFRLVAWDDEDGSGGGFLVDAPFLIQPGTISAGELVITDHGYNLVADNQLQSPTYWTNRTDFEIIKETASDNADSRGEMRWIGGDGAGDTSDGDRFQVRAGQILTCSFQVGRIGGTHHVAGARLIFRQRDGTLVNGVQIGAMVDATAAAIVDVEDKITVPSGSRTAAWRWVVDDNDGGGNVRFFAPSVIKREKGSSLITPDGAFFGMLTAETAWIGEANIIDLSVSTIKIKGGATGRSFAGARSSSVILATTGVWENILSLTMPSNLLPAGATARALVNVSTYIRMPDAAGSGGAAHDIGLRVLIGGASIFSDEYDFGSGTERAFLVCSPTGSVSNSQVIQVQMRRANGGQPDVAKANMSALILFQAG